MESEEYPETKPYCEMMSEIISSAHARKLKHQEDQTVAFDLG